MKTPTLFTALPDYIATPDSMAIDSEGNLVLSCPNFADLSLPGCVVKIDQDGNVRKWFDVPVREDTGMARPMGIGFGPDGDLYVIDNQGWLESMPEVQFKGRLLRIRMDGDKMVKCTVVANNMEHPNGLRIKDGYVYLTQSYLHKEKHPSGNLLSCVYRFGLDEENIEITNTLADPHILTTFVTSNPLCQYGVDGIVFDREGRLIIGNFGDGSVWRLYLSEKGDKIIDKELWCCDPENLKTTDGMTIDKYGNIYVADFSANAIGKISPDGKITRLAQSPDCTGWEGGLDEPGEPCVWGDKIIISCFDCVVDDQKVNTAHEIPATMAMLDVEP